MKTIGHAFLSLWIFIFIGAFVWIGLVYYNYRSLPIIVITNSSDTALNDVLISGHGFEDYFEVIEAKKKKRFKAKVAGESGVSIKFTANSQQYEKLNSGYIETRGGYRATILIEDDFGIVIKTSM